MSFDDIEERLTVLPAVIQEPAALAVVAMAEALGVIADQQTRIDGLEARLERLERRARPWWRFWERWR